MDSGERDSRSDRWRFFGLPYLDQGELHIDISVEMKAERTHELVRFTTASLLQFERIGTHQGYLDVYSSI